MNGELIQGMPLDIEFGLTFEPFAKPPKISGPYYLLIHLVVSSLSLVALTPNAIPKPTSTPRMVAIKDQLFKKHLTNLFFSFPLLLEKPESAFSVDVISSTLALRKISRGV